MSPFHPATRTASKARIALAGPSGSGKTYTALAFAHTLGDRVAVIDTERGSASKYAGLNGWAFDTVTPDSFSPDSLVHLLGEAAEYDVVIVDSLSHYWMGVDGMLEQADRMKRGANSFSGWKEARPAERRMIDALVSHPGHVIVTMRTKTEYVIEENERGKKEPRKVGMKPEQREGIEYEFDVVGELDFDNTLTVSKSRIHTLAKAVVPMPGAEFAEKISDWLSEGVQVPTPIEYRDRLLAAATADEVAVLGREIKEHQMSGAAIVVDGATATLLQLAHRQHETLKFAAPAESEAPA